MTRKAKKEWMSLGGQVEASYDGGKYINLRIVGDEESRIFISKELLRRSLEITGRSVAMAKPRPDQSVHISDTKISILIGGENATLIYDEKN